MSSSSLSFRDQLGFVSKKKKKKKGGSQKNGGDNTTNVDGDGPSLGTFPDSVHKLWALRKPGGWSPAEAPLSLPDTGGAIAICLTIVDQLPHENLWRRWLDGSGRKDRRGRVGRMHFHAKYPDKVRQSQPWVGERTLTHTYRPEWNDIRVARAMLLLLSEALSTRPNEEPAQFIYLGTESCIPIVPFSKAADVMWNSGGQTGTTSDMCARSFISAWPSDPPMHSLLRRPDKFEESSQFGAVKNDTFPADAVWKALPGWIVLSRQHAQAIVNLEPQVGGQLWPAFEDCFAPEEIFFPSLLALAGFTPDPDADARLVHSSSSAAAAAAAAAPSLSAAPVICRSLVFAEYPTSGENRANPIAWDSSFDHHMLYRRREEGYIFARKFKEPLTEVIQDAILEVRSTGPLPLEPSTLPPDPQVHKNGSSGGDCDSDRKRKRGQEGHSHA